jgi:hypothetical protein
VLSIVRSIDAFIRDKCQQILNKLDKTQSKIDKLQQSVNELQINISVQTDNFSNGFVVINKKLDEILALGQIQTNQLSVQFKFEDGSIKNSLGGLMFKLTDVQSVTATASETDAKGNPVTLNPASLVWASADTTKVSVTQNPDGSAVFAAVGPLTALPDGTDPGVQVSVTDGHLTQVDFIQVVPSEATTIGINFGQAQ